MAGKCPKTNDFGGRSGADPVPLSKGLINYHYIPLVGRRQAPDLRCAAAEALGKVGLLAVPSSPIEPASI